MRVTKNCLIQKLYDFKGGKIWRINFLYVSRGSKFLNSFLFYFFLICRLYTFSIINRNNIKLNNIKFNILNNIGFKPNDQENILR